MRLVLTLLVLLLTAPALRAADSCEDLAAAAGAEAGIPAGLMPAIARVESGRRGGAWPWTLNQGGKGMVFETRGEALAMLRQVVASGVTNIDVGCMQLNWRWHAPAFASADDMIDPRHNTRHAARFLVELRQRLGSWEAATAAYHSADRVRGTAYLAKVEAARGGVQLADAGDALPDEATMAEARVQGLLVLAPQPMVALGQAAGAIDTPDGVAIPLRAPRPVPGRRPGLLAETEVPPRLRARWAEIESFRAALAEQP